MTIASNVVTGSGEGVAKFSGGVVYTRQNNSVHGNTTDVVNGPFTVLSGDLTRARDARYRSAHSSVAVTGLWSELVTTIAFDASTRSPRIRM